MTEQDFKKELSELEKQHNKSKRELIHKYALAHNHFREGDIIEDHYHIIQIETMTSELKMNGLGTMVYIGIELKKDLKPKKKQVNKTMHQENVKRKLN